MRSVTIPDNAILFPMPTRAQQRERLPEKHPRLFMRPEDLPRMRAAAQDGPAAARFAAPAPATRKPATTSDTLTLLLPARVGKEVPCQAERIDSPTASGLRITRGGKTLRIAFRKHGVSAAEWDGTAFDGPVFVSALVH